ncbi:MAG TPA: sigma-70 family RNA polymerase sigma factor [Candidatus Acidoferrales bacterium]|nr:sigma-70 family RNA polymerase sigma factor [Candidatus Acidoferrales bacterium]
MSQSVIETILQRLRGADTRDAWIEFLARYSDHIYKAAYLTTSDSDLAADCYLHACVKLCANNFKRLLSFRPEGPAKFETWLSVVARNLCLDCVRSRFGRKRLFRSLQRLPQIESEIFRLRVEQGMSLDETVANLRPLHPNLTTSEVQDAETRVQKALSPRQRWLLQQQSAERETLTLDAVADGKTAPLDSPDPAPSPEIELLAREDRERLDEGLKKLEPEERLLVRLRFDEDLTLIEIAKLTEFGDAQRVHYRLNAALAKLRNYLE